MKSKIYLTLISGISILMFLSMISSFMPPTHYDIFQKSIKDPIDSDYYRAVIKYPDLAYASNSLVDSAVIWYYTLQGRYTQVHSPSFCSKLIDNVNKVQGLDPDKAMACAIGGCTHQPADLPSHSTIGSMDGMVSYSIKHSLIVNQVVHVFSEQHEDNWVQAQPGFEKAIFEKSLVDSYKTCQPLFVQAMLGESSYRGMSQADLDKLFDTYITEVVSSQTGYDPAFENKSFFVTLKSVPITLILIYIVIMLFFLILSLLLVFKIIRKKAKLRHYIGIIIFLPIFILLAYFLWGASQGSAFKTFIGFISPISNWVPIGEPSTWEDIAIKNTKAFLTEGETWLKGTDSSGFGAIDVLNQASNSVLIYDYIILGVLVLALLVFIWFLFKKNKVKDSIDFGI